MGTRPGAEYVAVTLEDIERYLKRAFRVMRPRQGVFGKVYFYDLKLSDNVGVRVFTSVTTTGEVARGRGESAIRIGLCKLGERYLKKGKQKITKRTTKWRDNLRNRIEKEIEEYESNPDKWERLAGATPNQITDAQKALIERLHREGVGLGVDTLPITKDLGFSPAVPTWTKDQASQFIDAIKLKVEAAKKAKARGEQEKAKEEEQERFKPPEGKAAFKFLKKINDWGLQGYHLEPGMLVEVVKKNGSKAWMTVDEIVWQDRRTGLTYATYDEGSRQKYAALLADLDESEEV